MKTYKQIKEMVDTAAHMVSPGDTIHTAIGSHIVLAPTDGGYVVPHPTIKGQTMKMPYGKITGHTKK